MRKANLQKVVDYTDTVFIFALFFGLACLIAERLDWSLLAILATLVAAGATITYTLVSILQRRFSQALYRGWISGSATAFLAFFSLSSHFGVEVPFSYFLIGLFGWALASLMVILLMRTISDNIASIETK